jgi:hypothetical protein
VVAVFHFAVSHYKTASYSKGFVHKPLGYLDIISVYLLKAVQQQIFPIQGAVAYLQSFAQYPNIAILQTFKFSDLRPCQVFFYLIKRSNSKPDLAG